jgi:hypothetical protein
VNRQAVVGVLDGTINGEGSGDEEWLQRTKSNNSLNPTALSLSLINIYWLRAD